MNATAKYDNYFFNIALAYGGREEIIHAIQQIADDIKKGNLKVDSRRTLQLRPYTGTHALSCCAWIRPIRSSVTHTTRRLRMAFVFTSEYSIWPIRVQATSDEIRTPTRRTRD